MQQSDHLQARKNLRYLELKEGASAPEIEHWQQQLTTLPLNLYQNLYRASLWVLLIAMLLLRLFRPQRPTTLLILIFLMPITAILAAIGCYFYPDTERSHSLYSTGCVPHKNEPLPRGSKANTAPHDLGSQLTGHGKLQPWILALYHHYRRSIRMGHRQVHLTGGPR